MEDWEYSDYICPKCGQQLRYRDCDNCDDGYITDLFEQDPLWYNEGDEEICSECNGTGGFYWCGNKNCDITDEEIGKAINQQYKEQYGDLEADSERH